MKGLLKKIWETRAVVTVGGEERWSAPFVVYTASLTFVSLIMLATGWLFGWIAKDVKETDEKLAKTIEEAKAQTEKIKKGKYFSNKR